jgi:D-alanine-D-alanine ligase
VSKRTQIVVIGGGENSEHEVSLASASAIRAALDPDRYRVLGLTILRDGTWANDAGEPLSGVGEAIDLLVSSDLAFPALHGVKGEDGTLAGFLDVISVPYVGSGVRAGALAMDKWATKLIAHDLGIATAPSVRFTAKDDLTVASQLGFPLVVKPVESGSSIGVSRVAESGDLRAAVDAALQHDSAVLAEKWIHGREVDLAVLERTDGSLHVAPPLEIVKKSEEVLDYETKYADGAYYNIPGSVTEHELRALEEAARTIFRGLGCAGIARCDFFLSDAGPILNEVNTMPGFTGLSQVPKMFAHAGIDYPSLLDLLVDEALARPRHANQ